MDTEVRRVLIVGEVDRFMEHVAPVLEKHGFEVVRVSDITTGADKAQSMQFELLLVLYSNQGMSVAELLKTLRWSGSPNRSAIVVLLSPPDTLEEAEAFLDKGVCRILNPDAHADVLQKALSEVVEHEVRYPVRALIRISGEDIGHKGTLMTQSSNVSTTGMLVRFDKPVLVGSRFTFSFETPGLPKALRGNATVVRLTDRPTAGFAARFIAFEGSGWARLKDFLAAQPVPSADNGS